jgi:hypothetical protein
VVLIHGGVSRRKPIGRDCSKHAHFESDFKGVPVTRPSASQRAASAPSGWPGLARRSRAWAEVEQEQAEVGAIDDTI